MLPLNLHHTALAVRDLDAALERLSSLLGIEPLWRETISDQGVEEAMVPVGGSFLQLLEPTGDDTPVGRHLARRGEGLHHIAVQVADIDAAIAHLVGQGVELVDDEATAGGGGSRIAFVHPRWFHGVLLELVEVE